jgi:uncharacterized lipoprotein YbaY
MARDWQQIALPGAALINRSALSGMDLDDGDARIMAEHSVRENTTRSRPGVAIAMELPLAPE